MATASLQAANLPFTAAENKILPTESRSLRESRVPFPLSSNSKFLRISRNAAPAVRLRAVRAVKEEAPATDLSEKAQVALDNLKDRWERVEDKPTFVAYAAGATAALWFSSAIVSAFNSVPVLPKVLELIGFGYVGWFVYRYLIFTPNRQELVEKIEELTQKITGEEKKDPLQK